MTKSELEQHILKESKELPLDILREVLDFIKFKKSKTSDRSSFASDIKDKLSHLNESSLQHLEDEFHQYREKYPREQ